MSLMSLAKQLEKYAIDNSPSICTAIGVVGTVATAYLTGKAAYEYGKHMAIQELAADNGGKPVDPLKERFIQYWPELIPPVLTGVVTIGCIIGANRIGSRRAAAVAAAYSLSEKAFAEYKDKVVEKFGESKEKKVREAVSQDKVEREKVSAADIIMAGGDVLCRDEMSGRYFMSHMEKIRKAQNDINNQIIQHNYASLTDFYDCLDLPRTQMSDEVGWNTDQLLTLEFTTALTGDNKPCLCIAYRSVPIREFYKLQ